MIELSIIIPTYNRAVPLRTCLEALCQQTQSSENFEVIVVIDGATDSTARMIETLKTPFAIRVIWQENSGQWAARNHGLRFAAGRYCLFLDDDIIPAPTLVAAHLRVQRERAGVVGIGQLTVAPTADDDWFVQYFTELWKNRYTSLNQGSRLPSWRDCYSGNVSAPRVALIEVGGFALDLSASQDVELGYRLEQAGWPIVYIPDAVGQHDDSKGFRALIRDAEKQGIAAVELCRRHPHMLPQILGSFNEASWRAILLRRILLALRISSIRLAIVGAFLRRSFWAREWHRFAHSYGFWRGVRRAVPDRATWQSLTRGTPILMYHAFGAPGEPASRYVVPARRFAQQLALLRWMGYRVLRLEEFLRCRHECRLPPARSVVITIDDGYADNQTHAYPLLRRYGIAATIFLVSGEVGAANCWDNDTTLHGRPLLSQSDIQELKSGNIDFGAHTRTHPVLTDIPLEQAREEIVGSRADLERELEQNVPAFAYPYGKYDTRLQAIVEQAGFLGACGVRSGLNTLRTPLCALRRIEVYGTDSLVRFILTLIVGDDRLLPRWKKV